MIGDGGITDWLDRIEAVLLEADSPMTPGGVASTIIARMSGKASADIYQNLHSRLSGMAAVLMHAVEGPDLIYRVDRLLEKRPNLRLVKTEKLEGDNDGE